MDNLNLDSQDKPTEMIEKGGNGDGDRDRDKDMDRDRDKDGDGDGDRDRTLKSHPYPDIVCRPNFYALCDFYDGVCHADVSS